MPACPTPRPRPARATRRGQPDPPAARCSSTSQRSHRRQQGVSLRELLAEVARTRTGCLRERRIRGATSRRMDEMRRFATSIGRPSGLLRGGVRAHSGQASYPRYAGLSRATVCWRCALQFTRNEGVRGSSPRVGSEEMPARWQVLDRCGLVVGGQDRAPRVHGVHEAPFGVAFCCSPSTHASA
jgi:hypothetical protein